MTTELTSQSLAQYSLEPLVAQVVKTHGEDNFIEAKEFFFKKIGTTFPDDPWYEDRMNYFICCFLFDENFSKELSDQTPQVQLWKNTHQESDQHILDVEHSLYVVKKVTKDHSIALNLFTNNKIKILSSDTYHYDLLSTGCFFQGFAAKYEDDNYRLHAMIIHPENVLRLVKSHIKRIQKSSDNFTELLYELSKIHLQFHRHKRLNPKDFYKSKLDASVET